MDFGGVLPFVTGGAGVVFGAYGAWRSWRTDRAIRLLGERWRVTHFQRNARLLENRMPKAALDVVLRFPDGTSLSGLEGNLSRIEPGYPVKIVVFRSFGGGDLFDIEWKTHRRGRVHHARLALALALAPEPTPLVVAAAPRAGRPV